MYVKACSFYERLRSAVVTFQRLIIKDRKKEIWTVNMKIIISFVVVGMWKSVFSSYIFIATLT